MTNRDKLNSMTDEELSDFFCKAMEDIADKTKDNDWCCDLCPVTHICKKGHNGFLAWLKSDADPKGDGNA